jgi:hypothetical protein
MEATKDHEVALARPRSWNTRSNLDKVTILVEGSGYWAECTILQIDDPIGARMHSTTSLQVHLMQFVG